LRLRDSSARVAGSLVFAMLLAANFAGCSDWFVLPPLRQSPNENTTQRLFRYGDDGARIGEAYVAGSAAAAARLEPEAFVLRFTGGDAPGAAAYTALRWRNRPVEVWVVNYPGYSGSSGPRRLRQMTPLALAAFDEIKRVAGERPIYVEGFSLGTVPALAVAARRPVAGAVIQNPPPLRQLIVGHHGWWNLWLIAWPVAMQIPADCDSLANARASAAPAVFVIADHDQTIPPVYQHKLVDAYAGDKRLVIQQNADHVTPMSDADEAKLQAALDWMWSRVR
jgi:hypothetical protein